MGLCLSRSFGTPAHLLHQFLCSIRKPFLRPDPRCAHVGGQEPSKLAVAHQPCGMLRLCHHTLTASSPTACLVRSGSRSEGSPLSGADQSRRNLVSGGSKDPNHDAAMRIGSEAPKRRTHSFLGITAMAQTGTRHLEPSSATITSGRT